MNLRIAAAIVILLALAGTHWKAYVMGKDRVEAAWEAAKLEAENQAEALRLLRQSAVNKVAKTHAEKARKSADAVQSNLAKVDQYAPASFPPLPGSFRVWHDAAAAGEEVDDSARAAAASVSLRETEARIAHNYASANYDKERLAALQDIVKASGCFDTGE